MSSDAFEVRARERLESLKQDHQRLTGELARHPLWQQLIALESAIRILVELLDQPEQQGDKPL